MAVQDRPQSLHRFPAPARGPAGGRGGNRPTTLECKNKGVYAMADLQRWAMNYQVDFAPSPFWQFTLVHPQCSSAARCSSATIASTSWPRHFGQDHEISAPSPFMSAE